MNYLVCISMNIVECVLCKFLSQLTCELFFKLTCDVFYALVFLSHYVQLHASKWHTHFPLIMLEPFMPYTLPSTKSYTCFTEVTNTPLYVLL